MTQAEDRIAGGGSEGQTPPGRCGADVIKECVASLDNSPGVYRMLNQKGEVLYVGKARSLRNRVRAYVNPDAHNPRIAHVIEQTASMMFLTTETETEALLLEQNLIKQLKPRYNVLLRDDKSFPSILVSQKHAFPQIKKHRGRKVEKGSYFGPFASAGAVNRTLKQLQRVFLLRSCSDSVLESRSRPCLLYQIQRCCAPCVGLVSEADYAELVEDAERFLGGKSSNIQAQLAQQMNAASRNLEFERAAALRDRIKALTQIQSVQSVNPKTVSEADVVSVHSEGGNACVQVFFIRANQNWGNHAYFPRIGTWADESEILEAFLGQFYSNKTPARNIILSHELESPDLMVNLLSGHRGRRVKLTVPVRGEKAALVAAAVRNAREALAMRQAETRTQAKLLRGLGEFLGLDSVPQRVEVFDNSHVQGAHQVGAMIVAGPEGFVKSAYRKFNIRSADMEAGDDYAMMDEVLRRRFGRLLKSDPGRDGAEWPDLVLIDGGAGHVSVAMEALTELGADDIPLAGVAKGRQRNAGLEEFHLPGGRVSAMQQNNPVLYFVQRIRDEAHRFAIGAHRAKRSKSITSSPLSAIPGVGSRRKSALMSHFGSAKAVSRAGLEDLKAVKGISVSLAETIYRHFQDSGQP